MSKLFEKSLLLRLGLAMATIVALAFAGMVSSVFIAEASQGQATAINQAGTLRMQSYRIASEIATQGTELNETQLQRARELIAEFDARLQSSRLTGVLTRTEKRSLHQAHYHVKLQWRTHIKPMLEEYLSTAEDHLLFHDGAERLEQLRQQFLNEIDGYVSIIDALVKVLEEEAEKKIELLRLIQIVSLFLTILVVSTTMYLMHVDVLGPLRELLNIASAIRRGDFSQRTRNPSKDELGQLGNAFNLMTEDLSRMYGELEERVKQKTADLERSNRSLELLYKTTSHLSQVTLSNASYEHLLKDIEELAGTGPGTICLGEDGNSQAFKLVSTRESAFNGADVCNPPNCQACFSGGASHIVEVERNPSELLRVFSTPIKDVDTQYGVLLLELPPDKSLQEWQQRLLETVARHIATALNMSQRSSQARMLALLEERGVIARELHDSLAQSLSYLKIQVSRLDAAVAQGDNGEKIRLVTAELRDGLNSAYRQLRELLTTFRLRMDEAGLNRALEKTVEEFCQRSKVEIELDNHLGGCKLAPNAEIHVIQVVREALSNVVRHARASHAVVSASCSVDGDVRVAVDDDGIGMPEKIGKQHHYGLAIMQERAHGVAGQLRITPSALGGTCVELEFSASGKWQSVEPAREKRRSLSNE
ncbi:MAG: type IV pili methyl-accepting chemotaxis transducer N-terminal domain-containing protein [Gammaproteobacteria bacterium]|nr:type IV pili methyl-accepting chemotaxis transducer N-terminal domain-containing protein [Gammaproteobacteria bacterium]